jgi:hypothetical protein
VMLASIFMVCSPAILALLTVVVHDAHGARRR